MSQPAQIMAPQQLPPPHVSPKKTWGTKIGFRIASFIFCIVIIGLSAHQATSRYSGVYALVFMVPPVSASRLS
jgi:CDP-diglyceride synthetase